MSLASACTDSTGTAHPPPHVTAITVDSTAGPIFRSLVVTLQAPAAYRVDYWTGAAPRLRVERSPGAATDSVFLPRLRPNVVYNFEVRTVATDGRLGDPYRGTLTTDPLPIEFANLRFVAHGVPTLPLIMLEVRTPGSATAFQGYVAVDGDGEVVWYWATIPEGFTRRANGNFVVLVSTQNAPGRLVELRPDRREVRELALDSGRVIHHDVVATPDNTLLFIEQETRVINDTAWTGEAVWEWHPESGLRTKRWSAFDFLMPDTDRGAYSVPTDWLHANSLSLGPRGNVVLSFPSLNQIVSIAPGFGALEWRLGGPRATIAVPPEAAFSFEHSALEVTTDRVLLFDNGRGLPIGSRFSRGLELHLDRVAGTATRVWEFRPQPDIWAPIVGSVRRLVNGNTVVGFGVAPGFLQATGPIAAYEVTPSGRVVWDLHVEGTTVNYRATPLTDIGGERAVPEP